jgi:hypothetical protein
MNTNTNPRNRFHVFVIAVAILIVFIFSACDENPCANGSACGLTSPVTSSEQAVIDLIAPDAQNTLSGGN